MPRPIIKAPINISKKDSLGFSSEFFVFCNIKWQRNPLREFDPSTTAEKQKAKEFEWSVYYTEENNKRLDLPFKRCGNLKDVTAISGKRLTTRKKTL